MADKQTNFKGQDDIQDLWLMRPCEVYKEEYYDCKKLLSRFYQYYIDGGKNDCTKWWTDYNNCMKYRKTKDPEAAEAVIASDKERRRNRLLAARANNVWEYRTSPPAEWFAPLGEEQSNVRG